MTFVIALGVCLALAYANGANDTFKGVATLFGSGTTGYRNALMWAVVTTLLGSLMALALAQGLIATFSGKGLVPAAVLAAPAFPLAVAVGAAITIMLATRLGLPVSTTHALTGALVGVGVLASPSGVHLGQLWRGFFAPLLISPVIAVVATAALYPMLHRWRTTLHIDRATCVCIGSEVVATFPAGTRPADALLLAQAQGISIGVDTDTACQERYRGRLLGLNAGTTLDVAHYLSAGAVSFARGLNDTPKIVALLLAAQALPTNGMLMAVAAAMAIGGMRSAGKVADTMAHRLTEMNAGQGLTANIATSIIVIFASRLGLPVSTTHVACGALFGIGAATSQGHWKTIATIVAAWIVTLPLGAGLGMAAYLGLSLVGI